MSHIIQYKYQSYFNKFYKQLGFTPLSNESSNKLPQNIKDNIYHNPDDLDIWQYSDNNGDYILLYLLDQYSKYPSYYIYNYDTTKHTIGTKNNKIKHKLVSLFNSDILSPNEIFSNHIQHILTNTSKSNMDYKFTQFLHNLPTSL